MVIVVALTAFQFRYVEESSLLNPHDRTSPLWKFVAIWFC
jgi:hypothetical protein